MKIDDTVKKKLSLVEKGLYVSAFACVVVLVGMFIVFGEKVVRTQGLVIKPQVGAEIRLNVEIADSPAEQEKGLMFRKELAPNHGMLFLFPQEQVLSFWMKNTFIPLDMIFIDKTGKIVSITKNAEPQTQTPRSSEYPARATLEIIGGGAARLGIAVGDRVIHPYFQ